MNSECSESIRKYFSEIEVGVNTCYALASQARKLGLDPEKDVPIPLAKNMAERVVSLISVVAPQLIGVGIDLRIIELEKEYGLLDWRVAFNIAEEVAKQKFCQFNNKAEALEVGIRVGFAYLTLGIVSAPLEGFIGLKLKKRKDGQEYFALQYAGPIRAAGGTAAAVSVILSDYVRVHLGYARYDPDENEINRYITEVHDYHDRVTNLQYHPSDEELRFMLSNIPVEVDGDPTEKFEVSNYKDLPRIETNLIRGGVALVLAEGLTQKAPKLLKRIKRWGKEVGLEWDFLEEFIQIKERIHAANIAEKKEDSPEKKDDKEEKKVKPNNTFIMDLVAGRPILTHPMAVGGFRLRYGRTRCSGFSTCAVHPATLIVLNKFIAIGTQLKMERPGKATTVSVCDILEGPVVRLDDGSVLRLDGEEQAKKLSNEVKEVLFLGDILFNYGDFSENGHILVPPGYCPEWWAAELSRAIEDKYEGSIKKASFSLSIPEERLTVLLKDYFFNNPSFDEAKVISEKLSIPLHPEYTFYWKLISLSEFQILTKWLDEAKIKLDQNTISKIILPYFGDNDLYISGKKILDNLGLAHQIVNKENVVIAKNEASALALCLNFSDNESLQRCLLQISKKYFERPDKENDNYPKDGLQLVNLLSPVMIRDKAGTFIGARMGRPEKAKMRAMTGSPQVMFPVGDEGNRLRSFQAAISAGKVNSVFPLYYCPKCDQEMVYPNCEECSQECVQKYYCRFCGDLQKESCRHGDGLPYKNYDLDVSYYFNKAMQRLGETIHPDLIKGIRGTSNKNHVVEHLSKGILRAKHNIYVNKDGTTRYDCTELPITHFKAKEIKTSVEKLKQLGYTHDIFSQSLENDDQVLEIKPQDIILPGFDALDESAPKVLSRVANFIDELLVKFYHLSPFYNISKQEDLVGHLVIGLAPHISAGLVGRIIGFSETQGLITHPMYHAGMRRDCDGDEACVMLLMDALLNFSRRYLPERRGAKTMDAPLVLTSILYPSEVDDQVHGIDVVWRYPLEFYEAALQMRSPWEVKYGPDKKKVEQLADRLGTQKQYEDFGFTHPVSNFNKGVQCSAYKTLPSMEEKLFGQMEIAQKVRAVDMDDVAKLVIQKHLLRDIKGNLRKFSMQQFRCVKCNAKYRRPPLTSICTACKGKLTFTISEGSVTKYLGHSLLLAEKYDFSPYLKQVLQLLKVNIDVVFGKEKEKQVGLTDFVN